MSNKGKFIDRCPSLPFAGKTTALEDISADQSIRQDLYFKPSTVTPEHIVKFRKATREVPGVKQLHYGYFNDPKDYENLIHGVKSAYSDHVPDCIKGRNYSGTKYFMNTLNENKFYASRKREPLGKGLIRDYIFPEEVKQEKFKFGIPTIGFYNAKDVIYNAGNLEEPPEVKTMYAKTHGLSDPGEQKDRKYKWYFDKKNHTFGLPQEKEIDGAKKSLVIDTAEYPYPKTKLVNSRLENFRQATANLVGVPSYHGTLHPKIGPDHTFGLPGKNDGNWTAAKCIFGDPKDIKKEMLEPDKDLGRDFRYKSKLKNLQPIEHDPNRVCGVASVRKDLPKKKRVCVTDITNYGDEEDAFELLYPHPLATMGVKDKEFGELHDKEEVFKILKDNGYKIPEEELNTIYEITIRNYPQEEGKISYQSFVSTLKNLQNEHKKYKNLIADLVEEQS
ncbi:MAG: hypothetical protein MJ252_10575 [archaeon]|nr:hypothetical protein [archaeon]